ncbi:MAG: tetratricopeptide repeat protein [Polyangiaceae bacterium]|jgi:tetratricopeptide (TPR) repeat protein|nr:tetratricopeptide repeat protein [Polyangiaceae bacterium]
MSPLRRVVALIALAASCSPDEPQPAAGTAPASAAVLGASSAETPGSAAVVYTAKTTSPSVELNNLDSQINGAEKALAQRTSDLDARSRLVGLLLLRSRILGRASDLARAVELAEEGPTIAPEGHAGYVLRARGRASAHRFAAALEDLEIAEKQLPKGVSVTPIRTQRASVLAALGRMDEAVKLFQTASRLEPTTTSLVDYASVLARAGQEKEADATFLEAELKFRSLSPIPLVELYFERGSMWERAGDLGLATQLYRAANARLPQHVHVAIHLAALVPPSEGVALLTPLTDTSDDPDLFAQLGSLKNQLEKGSGDALIDKAKGLYASHSEKLPEAYADHAGWFWIGVGRDPQRGLAAAQKNLEGRQTADAYLLLLAAAEAASDKPAICGALRGAKALKFSSPRLEARTLELGGKISCPDGGITPAPSTSATAAPR